MSATEGERRSVTVAAHVSRTLAEQIRRLAVEGNRSISREAAAALKAHIERRERSDG